MDLSIYSGAVNQKISISDRENGQNGNFFEAVHHCDTQEFVRGKEGEREREKKKDSQKRVNLFKHCALHRSKILHS